MSFNRSPQEATWQQLSPEVIPPKPEAVAELGQLRRRELQVVSDRLGRVTNTARSRWWGAAAGILVSTALGSLVTGIPLLSSGSDWDSWVIPAYGAAVVVCLTVAAICGMAFRSVRQERADSISAIKEDLDRLLGAYDLQPEPVTAALDLTWFRADLQRLRREVDENARWLRTALETGRYWRVSEGGPQTKAWKEFAPLIEGEESLEALYDKASHAANEVDRITALRTTRILRLTRTVEDDDRLSVAVGALDECADAITQAMHQLDQPRQALGS